MATNISKTKPTCRISVENGSRTIRQSEWDGGPSRRTGRFVTRITEPIRSRSVHQTEHIQPSVKSSGSRPAIGAGDGQRSTPGEALDVRQYGRRRLRAAGAGAAVV